MQNELLLAINDICKDNDVTFDFRHDQINNIFHCIFTKEDKSIKFSINYYIMLFQPTWITVGDIKTRVSQLCN